MTRSRPALLAALLIGSALLARPAAADPTVHVIHIADMQFGAAPAGIRVGDAVEWVNDDMFEHTATARDHSFDLDLKPGATARIIVRSAGEIAYFCRFHPGMTGRLVVQK
jgi:plastocyanin